MDLFLIGLLIACLLNPSYGIVDCPPVITTGKLLGVLPKVNQKVSYPEVADCGAVSRAYLFRRIRLWTAQSCYSPGDTFWLSDKEIGDRVGRVDDQFVKNYLVLGSPLKAKVAVKTRCSKVTTNEYELPFAL